MAFLHSYAVWVPYITEVWKAHRKCLYYSINWSELIILEWIIDVSILLFFLFSNCLQTGYKILYYFYPLKWFVNHFSG